MPGVETQRDEQSYEAVSVHRVLFIGVLQVRALLFEI